MSVRIYTHAHWISLLTQVHVRARPHTDAHEQTRKGKRQRASNGRKADAAHSNGLLSRTTSENTLPRLFFSFFFCVSPLPLLSHALSFSLPLSLSYSSYICICERISLVCSNAFYGPCFSPRLFSAVFSFSRSALRLLLFLFLSSMELSIGFSRSLACSRFCESLSIECYCSAFIHLLAPLLHFFLRSALC